MTFLCDLLYFLLYPQEREILFSFEDNDGELDDNSSFDIYNMVYMVL